MVGLEQVFHDTKVAVRVRRTILWSPKQEGMNSALGRLPGSWKICLQVQLPRTSLREKKLIAGCTCACTRAGGCSPRAVIPPFPMCTCFLSPAAQPVPSSAWGDGEDCYYPHPWARRQDQRSGRWSGGCASGEMMWGGGWSRLEEAEPNSEPRRVWQQRLIRNYIKGSLCAWLIQCQSLNVSCAVCASVWQVMLLIDIELAYMNTNHEDFIGFAK